MQVYSVSEINAYLRSKFLNDGLLKKLMLRGEISNFKCHSSGHCYLTLKDGKAAIQAVIFRSAAQKLRFAPQNGMLVIACGAINVYERDGTYQLYIETLLPEGVGELTLRFEQLKKKLQAQGVFDQAHKRPLPLRPTCIGIVTSQTGAVLHDIFHVASLRDPSVRLLLYPAQVQGETAAGQIVAAIESLNSLQCCDVLIVGRGGGSMEDLWAFNEEVVVQAIYHSRVPVVTAIGHETDFTLSDFAADRRAATPSQAAEFCVPQRSALLEKIAAQERILRLTLKRRLSAEQVRLQHCQQNMPKNLAYSLQQRLQRLQGNVSKLERRTQAAIADKELSFVRLAERYEGLNPEKILKHGYAVLHDNKQAITKVAQLHVGSQIEGNLQDGIFTAQITAVEMEGNNGKEKNI